MNETPATIDQTYPELLREVDEAAAVVAFEFGTPRRGGSLVYRDGKLWISFATWTNRVVAVCLDDRDHTTVYAPQTRTTPPALRPGRWLAYLRALALEARAQQTARRAGELAEREARRRERNAPVNDAALFPEVGEEQ